MSRNKYAKTPPLPNMRSVATPSPVTPPPPPAVAAPEPPPAAPISQTPDHIIISNDDKLAMQAANDSLNQAKIELADLTVRFDQIRTNMIKAIDLRSNELNDLCAKISYKNGIDPKNPKDKWVLDIQQGTFTRTS
jgi:hypothetical protein